MYAADYPFLYGDAHAFLERAPLSADDKERIAHGNWERLMARLAGRGPGDLTRSS